MRLRLFALAGLCCLLAACAVQYRESDFMRAQPGALLDAAQALAALPAGYRVDSSLMDTPDGERLHRVAFTHPQARSDLLFFPGNLYRSDTQAAAYAGAFASAWRVNVILYDYRGRGLSTGAPGAASGRADALRAFDAEHKSASMAGRKLVVGGFSLGGAMAGAVAEQRSPAALLLLATTTDAREYADAVIPWYAKPFLSVAIAPEVAAIDNRRGVKAYSGPLLVAVGANDRATPPALSERLFAASATAPERKRLVVAPGIGHNDLLRSADFQSALNEFVAAHDL